MLLSNNQQWQSIRNELHAAESCILVHVLHWFAWKEHIVKIRSAYGVRFRLKCLYICMISVKALLFAVVLFFSLLSLRLAGKAVHGCCSWHVSGSAWQSGATPLRTCEQLGLQCLRFWLQHCSMVLNIPSSRHNDGSLFELYFLKVLVEFVDEDGDGNLNLSESFGCKKWARALLVPEVRYLRCWWWIWKAMRLRVPILNFRLFCHQITWKVHRSDQSDAHRHTSRSRGPAIHAVRWWPEWLSGPLHAQHYTAYGHGGLHSYNVPCTVIICYITQCTIYFFFGLLCWRD